jgi:hypothetical protein
MFRPYKAILRQLLIDWNRRTLSAPMSIYYMLLLHVVLAIGSTTEWSEFESWEGQEFCFLHVVQTGTGVHPTGHWG